MINANLIKLAQHLKAKTALKYSIHIDVKFMNADGVCDTKEGKVSYKAGDAIMTGVEGEQWPIERAKFDATYEPVVPTKAGENGTYAKKPIVVYALQMNEPFYVNVSWADDRLEGKSGDWLLQYSEDDYGIVSESIFGKTYQIIK